MRSYDEDMILIHVFKYSIMTSENYHNVGQQHLAKEEAERQLQ